MDEYNRGMDPELKVYFRKIMKSFTAGLVWFLVISTMGFMYKMAHIKEVVSGQNIFFYTFLFLSLGALIYYLLRIWKKDLADDSYEE